MKATDTLRASRDELVSELTSAGVAIRGNSVKCPFHDDKNPSASIYQGEDGAWRLKCHTASCAFCGDIFDIRSRLQNRPLADVLKAENLEKPKEPSKKSRVFPSVKSIVESVSNLGTVEAAYTYTDPDTGEIQVVQVRYIDRERGKKKFLTHRSDREGLVLGAPAKPWPIYNRTRIQSAPTVVVVEGEKCVHALDDIGIVATTSLSGAENGDKADWTPLAGKTVYIWPDNDASGQVYAKTVIRMLDTIDPRPRVYLLDVSGLGLPEGGDVVDLLQSDGAADDLWNILADGSTLVGVGTELQARIDDIVSGKWQSLPMPWRDLSRCAKALFPGSITVICGDPGSSKSFFLLEAMHWWHMRRIKVALYELEEDRPYHLTRLLAMIAGTWDVLDDDWGRNNSEKLKKLHGQYGAEVESFAPNLFSAPMGHMGYADLLKWVEERCKAGCEIIGIDPITAIATGESRQNEDLKFIYEVTQILKAHKARLILVTHPRGSSQKKIVATQDDLAGGRAFSRHTSTVLWLNRHQPAKDMLCRLAVGQMNVKCNREIFIAKTRNGPANGWRIGFNMGPDVRFAEQGVVTKE